MITAEVAPAPSRLTQRCYHWVIIGVAFLTVAMAFGARNAFSACSLCP